MTTDHEIRRVIIHAYGAHDGRTGVNGAPRISLARRDPRPLPSVREHASFVACCARPGAREASSLAGIPEGLYGRGELCLMTSIRVDHQDLDCVRRMTVDKPCIRFGLQPVVEHIAGNDQIKSTERRMGT